MTPAESSYYNLRSKMAQWVPGQRRFKLPERRKGLVQEKGRKTNYWEFKLDDATWVKSERLLDSEAYRSFAEISLRSAACPMCMNLDIYDGLRCIAKGELVLTRRGPVPIENITEIDEVLTMNEITKELEWKRVRSRTESIKSNMIEIETENGVLRLTTDHPVFTQRGWINAGDLTLNDELYKVE